MDAKRAKRLQQAESRQKRLAAAQEAILGKRPWEVTGDVWASASGALRGGTAIRRLYLSEHRKYVELALTAGLTVPESVRKEFENNA